MGRSRTALTRDEAASEREVRSKWGIGLLLGGEGVCGGFSGEIGQAQESANCLDARWWLDFDAE